MRPVVHWELPTCHLTRAQQVQQQAHDEAYLLQVYRHDHAAPNWAVAASDTTRISDARGNDP